MKKSIKSNFYGTIIFSVIILFFTGFSNDFLLERNLLEMNPFLKLKNTLIQQI